MSVERVSGGSSLIDVLDRVLDKGMVIDPWVRISLAGIDLSPVEARLVVASIAGRPVEPARRVARAPARRSARR